MEVSGRIWDSKGGNGSVKEDMKVYGNRWKRIKENKGGYGNVWEEECLGGDGGVRKVMGVLGRIWDCKVGYGIEGRR